MPKSSGYQHLDLPDTRHIKEKKGGFRAWWENVPNNKKYLELLAAILTIPVLLTVIILNWNALNGKKDDKKDNTPTPIVIKEVTQSAPTSASCKKEVGPVSINYPTEGQTVDDNPLNIIVKHDDDKYCSVVWSYRINGGQWSPYSSTAISIYNMDSGDKKLELRVQSTVSNDQTQVVRNFTYQGNQPTATPTQTPAPTSSSTL